MASRYRGGSGKLLIHARKGGAYIASMTEKPPKPPSESDDRSDLAERLSNYRSRVVREGRKVALKKIDRAIEEARQAKK